MRDALIGHRRQFAFTVVYHCLFLTLTIGLALLIVVMKTMALTFHGDVKVTCSPSPHRAYAAANHPEGFRTALHCGSSAFASPMPIASSIPIYIAVRRRPRGRPQIAVRTHRLEGLVRAAFVAHPKLYA